MKKVLTGVLAAAGAVMFGWGVTSMTKKAAADAAVTIIGKADGPTSVFIAGKVGDGFWWTITIIGGMIVGVSVALFVLFARRTNK